MTFNGPLSWSALRQQAPDGPQQPGALVLDVSNASAWMDLDRSATKATEHGALGVTDLLVVEYTPAVSLDATLKRVGPRGRVVLSGQPTGGAWLDALGERLVGVLSGPPTSRGLEFAWRCALDVALRGRSPSVGPASDLVRVARAAQHDDALTKIGDALRAARIPRRQQLAFLDALDGLLHAALNEGSEAPSYGSEVRVSIASDAHGVAVSVAELTTRRTRRQLVDGVRVGLGLERGSLDTGSLEVGAAVRASNFVAIKVTAGVATEVLCQLGAGHRHGASPSVVLVV